jgi:hypothetical protein
VRRLVDLLLALRGSSDVLEAQVAQAGGGELVDVVDRVRHGAVVVRQHENEIDHGADLLGITSASVAMM